MRGQGYGCSNSIRNSYINSKFLPFPVRFWQILSFFIIDQNSSLPDKAFSKEKPVLGINFKPGSDSLLGYTHRDLQFI